MVETRQKPAGGVEPLELTHPPRPGTEDRDVRYTPARCVEALLDVCPPPRGMPVLDCCAGNGAILRVLKGYGYRVQWVEVREAEREALSAIGEGVVWDWIHMSEHWTKGSCSIVTNPPYSIGPAILSAALETNPPYCAALLRLNHLGSASWFRFWQEHQPDGLIILGSFRPSFTEDGKTDASEYCWVVWQSMAVAVDGPTNGGSWFEWR